MEFVNQLQAIGMVIALILFWYQWRVKANRSVEGKRKQIPTPPYALPIVGHLYLLGGQKPTHRTLAAMADKYGPAILLNLGMHRTLVVSSWELVKECFTTNDKVFATRPPFAAAKYLGYNGAMSGSSPYGTYWRGIRKFFTLELLSKARLEKLKHVRVSTVDVAIKEVYSCWVKDGCSKPVKLEMGQWFEHLTLNLITQMIAGKRYYGNIIDGYKDEAHRFRKATAQFMYLFGVSVVSDALPYLEWLDML